LSCLDTFKYSTNVELREKANDLSKVITSIAASINVVADIGAFICPINLLPIILDISEEKSKFLTADINNILGLGIVDFTAERGEVTESLEDVR